MRTSNAFRRCWRAWFGTLDLTGGAPELHPRFRWLVAAARRVGVKVIDRCNLTILSEPGQEDLADFLAAHGVEVVASLPCYLEDNVDGQRGKGVFERSIAGLGARRGPEAPALRGPPRRRRGRSRRDDEHRLGEVE